jgi:hypothetical protein
MYRPFSFIAVELRLIIALFIFKQEAKKNDIAFIRTRRFYSSSDFEGILLMNFLGKSPVRG